MRAAGVDSVVDEGARDCNDPTLAAVQSSSRAVEDLNWSNESVGPGLTSFAACDKVYAEWCNSLPEVRGRWIPRTPSGR